MSEEKNQNDSSVPEPKLQSDADVHVRPENLIEIHDRVLDAYYGRMGEAMMRATQTRVHWICRAVGGRRILDVGCSQGIVPLLLGREGFEVVGVDLDAEAIEEANKQLEAEASTTRANVKFVCKDFMSHSFSGDNYDSIVLSEVLEHLTRPKAFVERAAHLLTRNGRLVVTLPFGVNDFIDHKKTYYLADAYGLLDEFFTIDDVANFGHWIGFLCTVSPKAPQNHTKALPRDLVLASEESYLTIEREYLKRIADINGRLVAASTKYKSTMDEKVVLVGKFRDLTDAKNKLSDQAAGLKKRVEETESDATEAKKQARLAEDRAARLQQDLVRTKAELSERIDKLKAEVEEVAGQRKDLVRTKAKLSERIDKLEAEAEEVARQRKRSAETKERRLRGAQADLKSLHAVQSEMAGLAHDLSVRCIRAEQNLAELQISTKVRFGSLIAGIGANPTKMLKLPVELARLWGDWRTYRKKGPPPLPYSAETAALAERIDTLRGSTPSARVQQSHREHEMVSSIDAVGLFWREGLLDGEKRLADEQMSAEDWCLLHKARVSTSIPVDEGAVEGLCSFKVRDTDSALVLEVEFVGVDKSLERRVLSSVTCRTMADGISNCLLVWLDLPAGTSHVNISISSGSIGAVRNEYHAQWLRPGISVVVPTHKGGETILSSLQSIAKQELDPRAFEVVLVRNGPDDSTPQIISEFQASNPALNIHLVSIDDVGAGVARNKGIALARRTFLTFLDDDDWITPTYLSSLLAVSDHSVLAVAQVCDVKDGRDVPSPVNRQIEKASGLAVVRPIDVQSVMCMNAAKALPSAVAKQVRFDVSLKSGEDVHYFSTLLVQFDLLIKVLPLSTGAVYRRRVRENSVSRQKESVDFSIRQRLDVIRCILDSGQTGLDAQKKIYLQSVMRSQANFTACYLARHPEDYGTFVAEVHQRDLCEEECVSWVNAQLADTLVFSYCFAPYIDTAGIITAKRIRQRVVPVDVVSNRMDSARKRDPRLSRLASGLIGHTVILDTPTSFGNWASIQQFADRAVSEGERLSLARGRDYTHVYSRAMWPGSHFAAAAFKAAHPNVYWTAEFSDPLWLDIEGHPREGSLDHAWLDSLHVGRFTRKRHVKMPKRSELFFWCEYLPYLMADELVFTNRNQLAYMTSYLEDDKLREWVEERAVIKRHPTLPASYYSMAQVDAGCDDEWFSIAYFGSFYKNRGLGDVLSAIKQLRESGDLLPVRLYVYTGQGDAIRNAPEYGSIRDNIVIRDVVGYLEFLALSAQFDCLVVSDTATTGKKIVNPYLPSKVSDYLGSDTDIWAIVEQGSALDELVVRNRRQFKYVSSVRDVKSHCRVIRSGLAEKYKRQPIPI